MSSFSLKLSEDVERKVRELMISEGYTYKYEVFLKALDVFYDQNFLKKNISNETALKEPSAISTETTSIREFRAVIVETTFENTDKEPVLSVYDRLVNTLGAYNGS